MACPLSRYTTCDEIGGKDFSSTRSLTHIISAIVAPVGQEGTIWVLSIAGVGGLLESDPVEHGRP
jgi:hypothetical protein